jgi:alpha-glucuronidase
VAIDLWLRHQRKKVVEAWKSLKGRVDDRRYQEVLAQLEYQEGQPEVWRDAVSNWFLRESGIADSKGRVGRYPGRVEAESMKLDGYEVKPAVPWESASGGKVVACASARCTASFRYDGEAGWRTINIRYLDMPNGVSRFRVWVAGQLIDEWSAADRFPARKLDGAASRRRVIHGIALRPGDEIRIDGAPDGGDPAAVDYVEIR